MKIQCPNCACTREMDESRIPDGVLTARCPSCGQTFRFSKQETMARAAEAPRSRGAARLGREDAGTGPVPGQEVPREEPRARQTPEPERGPAAAEDRMHDASPGGQREARAGDEGEWSFNPWECARSPQEFAPALHQTCLRVMFAARRFFSDLRPGPVLRALGFFLVICCLQTVIEHVWTVLFFEYLMPPAETTDPELRQLAEMMQSGSSSLLMALILRCALLTLQIYFFSSVLFLCWRLICGPRIDFSLVVQVLCYAEAPLVLCVIPGVGTVVGFIWSCAATIVGCRTALRLSWTQTLAGITPLIMLFVVFSMRLMSVMG